MCSQLERNLTLAVKKKALYSLLKVIPAARFVVGEARVFYSTIFSSLYFALSRFPSSCKKPTVNARHHDDRAREVVSKLIFAKLL